MALKLPLSELGIYGREKELSILMACFRRVKGNNIDAADAAAGTSLPEFVLVAGRAGTGKSTLIRKLRDFGTRD
jgi:predicted ATPase